jgi:flagella basal body P-ring formation protein FlgA
MIRVPLHTLLRAAATLAAALVLFAAASAPAPASEVRAEEGTVVAARAIRPRTVLMPSDVTLAEGATAGALDALEDAVGQEARVAIYQGRPIRPSDLGPPAMVDRNQLVEMRYDNGRLSITAEGRALGRAGAGERVQVMNLDSRMTVTGVVSGPGLVVVR